MSIQTALIITDEICEFIPFVSTVTSLVDLFIKYIILPQFGQTEINENHYFTHLQQKSFDRCHLLLVPFLGNICIVIYEAIFLIDSDEDLLELLRHSSIYDCSPLEYASFELRDNAETMLQAVKIKEYVIYAVSYASDRLKNDKSFMMACLEVNGLALEHASNFLKRDKDVVFAAVRNYGSALQYADEILMKDKDFIISCMEINEFSFRHTNDSWKKDRDVVLAAVKKLYLNFEYANEDLKNEKKFVTKCLESDPLIFPLVSENLRADREIVEIAIRKSHGAFFDNVSNKLKSDKQFVLEVMRDYVSIQILSASEIVGVNGLALQYARQEMKSNKELVLKAIKENAKALTFASSRLQNNFEFLVESARANAEAIQYFPLEILNDDKKVQELLKTHLSMMECNELRHVLKEKNISISTSYNWTRGVNLYFSFRIPLHP